jgi:ABC-type phosphate/phosphonate transport system permease subunit
MRKTFDRKGGDMRRQVGIYVVVLAMVFLGILASMTGPYVRAEGQQVIGTWFVTVYTSSGAQLATELATFNPGGTFADAISIAFNSENPAFTGTPLAVNFSDALGTWKQVGEDPNQVAMTFKRFLYAGRSTPAGVYGSFFPGQNVGVATIEAVGTLQNSAAGQTITGQFTFQLTDLAGNVVLPASGTFSAKRLEIQPLATP